ncbi:MAG TPA: glycosyltransferase family 39 protein, partial [Candidatus Dormibacteraeota bacterium]|nr:glycosyltransferase family 39 protein [Candidatus Dormibacteraeota bacterium]
MSSSPIERQPRYLSLFIVGLFTIAYFAATCALASLKPFSLDELDVFEIAQLPTADIWRAWFESGDGMPPMVHFATHLVGSALGLSHITARLPAMVGFWLMCVCIFIFLRRRVGLALAAIGMLLPVTAPVAYSYAYEARGYGIVLGFSGAAMVCWDLAHDSRWRRLALLGLPICLAAAIATHFYAVLVIVPLALGELARTVERRRVDWLLWAGCLAALVVLLPVNPVVAHVRGLREVAMRAHRVSVSELADVWSQFLSVSITYLGLLAIVCLAQGRWSAAVVAPASASGERRLTAADWALAVSWMALPVGVWLLANLVTGNFMFRYAIVTIVGFGLGVPLLCHMAVRHRPAIAPWLAGWVAVTAVGSLLAAQYSLRTTTLTTEHIAAGRGCARLLTLWGRLPADELPIVVADFNVFHQLHHYGSEGLRRRLVFVVDHQFGQLIEPAMPFYAR